MLDVPGTNVFTVLSGSGDVEMLLVGGGGSGGSVDGAGVTAGGGGGGGVLHVPAVLLLPGSYDVQVGFGAGASHADHSIGSGAFSTFDGNDGQDTFFADLIAIGGGGGGARYNTESPRHGRDGGCGGGGGSSTNPGSGGSGTVDQGFGGGTGSDASSASGGAGGGAGGPGESSTGVPSALALGGDPYLSDIDNVDSVMKEYSRGGNSQSGLNAGGSGGQATGIGTGGQGGGNTLGCDGQTGADGIIIVRYPIASGIVATGGTRTEHPL